MSWDLIFFRRDRGDEPVREFLRGLPKAARMEAGAAGSVAGGVSGMANKHKGGRVREWLDEELKDPAFREGFELARARRRVARQIYEARKRAGVSQPELARRLHTSQAAISRMEAGDQNMTIDIVENVARALGGRFEGRIVFGRPPRR